MYLKSNKGHENDQYKLPVNVRAHAISSKQANKKASKQASKQARKQDFI